MEMVLMRQMPVTQDVPTKIGGDTEYAGTLNTKTPAKSPQI